MKKIAKPLSKSYLPIALTKNDLIEIERNLRNICTKIDIEADGYAFSSIQELLNELPSRRLYELELTGHAPFVSMTFDKMTARLYVNSEAPASSGLFFELDRFLQTKQRWPGFMYTYVFVWAINAILILNAFQPIIQSKLREIILVPLSIWVFWACFVRLKLQSHVTTRESSNEGFFVRNSDSILTNVLTAVLSVALGVVGTILTQKYLK